MESIEHHSSQQPSMLLVHVIIIDMESTQQDSSQQPQQPLPPKEQEKKKQPPPKEQDSTHKKKKEDWVDVAGLCLLFIVFITLLVCAIMMIREYIRIKSSSSVAFFPLLFGCLLGACSLGSLASALYILVGIYKSAQENKSALEENPTAPQPEDIV